MFVEFGKLRHRIPLNDDALPRFALSAGFTDKQVSTFFSIMKRVLYDARGLLADRGVWPSLPQSFDTFKGLVLAHAGVQSGEEVIFDKDAVSKLTEYVTET